MTIDTRPGRLARVPVRDLLAEIQTASINAALDELIDLPPRDRPQAMTVEVLRHYQTRLGEVLEVLES